MNTKYLITQKELDKLEEARLQLVEIMEQLPSNIGFELSKVSSALWKTVNIKREEV